MPRDQRGVLPGYNCRTTPRVAEGRFVINEWVHPEIGEIQLSAFIEHPTLIDIFWRSVMVAPVARSNLPPIEPSHLRTRPHPIQVNTNNSRGARHTDTNPVVETTVHADHCKHFQHDHDRGSGVMFNQRTSGSRTLSSPQNPPGGPRRVLCPQSSCFPLVCCIVGRQWQ